MMVLCTVLMINLDNSPHKGKQHPTRVANVIAGASDAAAVPHVLLYICQVTADMTSCYFSNVSRGSCKNDNPWLNDEIPTLRKGTLCFYFFLTFK